MRIRMKLLTSILALLSSPAWAMAENAPRTLLQLVGVELEAGRLSDSVLLIIDAQREYVDGKLPLQGIRESLDAGSRLLGRARAAGTPVVHVVHRGGAALFDPKGPYFEVAEPLAPVAGERVVEKTMPNSFAGTDLLEVLKATGRKRLIVIGYMTHMCVSTTVRAALDLGFQATVVASATATRDLPDGHGGTVSAAVVQAANLAALSDRFARVVDGPEDIKD